MADTRVTVRKGPRQSDAETPSQQIVRAANEVYTVVDAQGRSLLYAVSIPNHSLEKYVGQRVALYGLVSYHQDDPRTDVMTVSWVAPLVQPQNRY